MSWQEEQTFLRTLMLNDFDEWLDIFEVIEVYGGNMYQLMTLFHRSSWCSRTRLGVVM